MRYLGDIFRYTIVFPIVLVICGFGALYDYVTGATDTADYD